MKENTPLRKADPATADGMWVDGVCDCCKDPGMCAIVYCCNPVNTGQLYERMVQKGLVQRIPLISCMSIAVFMWIAYAWTPVTSGIDGALANVENVEWVAIMLANVGMVLSVMTGIGLVLIVCTVRKSIRTRDGIEPGGCGDAEDCCCAFWCNSCTQCQLWRHERVRCAQYDLCSETGSTLAPDEIHEIKVV